MQSTNHYLKGVKRYANSNIMKHEDQKYIQALKENDIPLIEEIYKKYADLIQSLVLQNNGTIEEAKDLFQDALLIMYDYANNDFRLTCSFKSFFYTICKRRWINKLKAKQSGAKLKTSLINEKTFEVESEAELKFADDSDDRMTFCTEKFKMLGSSCQEILKMSWQKNEAGKHLSWKEVAELLDRTYGYVRKKASECKKRLTDLAQKDPKYNRYKFL